MKYYMLLLSLIALQPNFYSQESRIFVHPKEKYEIKIPEGWIYSQLSGSNLFVRTSGKSPIKYFTIIIAKSETTNLDESYTSFIYKISNTEGFKIVKEGEKIINNQKYKWFIENHKSSRTGLNESAYILFTNKEGKTLHIVMCTDNPKDFETAKKQFDPIAETLKY